MFQGSVFDAYADDICYQPPAEWAAILQAPVVRHPTFTNIITRLATADSFQSINEVHRSREQCRLLGNPDNDSPEKDSLYIDSTYLHLLTPQNTFWKAIIKFAWVTAKQPFVHISTCRFRVGLDHTVFIHEFIIAVRLRSYQVDDCKAKLL
jgi:hypothetical protein